MIAIVDLLTTGPQVCAIWFQVFLSTSILIVLTSKWRVPEIKPRSLRPGVKRQYFLCPKLNAFAVVTEDLLHNVTSQLVKIFPKLMLFNLCWGTISHLLPVFNVKASQRWAIL